MTELLKNVSFSNRPSILDMWTALFCNSIHQVGKALQTGMVGINEGMISATEAAFGGVKESGFGREGSRWKDF